MDLLLDYFSVLVFSWLENNLKRFYFSMVEAAAFTFFLVFSGLLCVIYGWKMLQDESRLFTV